MLLELISKLNANIQIRGRQFEHICKWYLENDPKYRLELKKVWLWKDWPGRWGPDCGIDLVAKAYDGKVWAIQAKAYDKQYPVKKSDIDTFLSESSRPEISFRLLISTTNLIGKTAQRTIESQEKKVGLALLTNLEKSEIEWPDSPDELFAKPAKPKKPRPHQIKAIDDVVKGFSGNERGQLIMACGTGKTLVSLWIAENLDCQRTLILLPSLSLLAQTLREWVINTSQNFHYLPVCSDDTVRGEDHFTSHTSELGLPVTTDPAEVANFLRKNSNLVIFSTYQSSPVIAKAFAEYSIPSFDLAIADEAHRCAGSVTGIFSTIMDENLIKAKRRLFMTATPRYFTDKAHKEAKELEYEIASMDDEKKFGPSFHRLNFSEAIRKDLLSDYQVVIIGVDNATYKKYAEYETIVTTDGNDATDAKTLASQIALIKAMRTYDLRRVISFHGRIKRAKKFSEQFPDVIAWMPEELRPKGEVWASHVSGEMSSGQRTLRLDRLRYLEDGERGLLSNARCLGEGVDVPTLDGVAFIDPRHSQIDIVQAVGRAIRKTPDKKTGIIVLPVFIDNSQDPESALESSAFKPIWDVLKALRAHDDVLAVELDLLRRQLGPDNDSKISLPDKLVIDLPVTVGEPFAEAFKVRVVKKTSSSWEFWYALVKQFVEMNGHAVILKGFFTKDGFSLGSWAATQRAQYQKGKLSKERQLLLEEIPGWPWDVAENKWQIMFGNLLKYIDKEGHAQVTRDFVTEDGYNLDAWINSQRRFYKRGVLLQDREKALEQIPEWFWAVKRANIHDEKWLKNFKFLREFVEREGHAQVPMKFATEEGFNLGIWVGCQRRYYRRGVLLQDREKALGQIAEWSWTVKRVNTLKVKGGKYNEGWIKKYICLREFVEREGHAQVPMKFATEEGFGLGVWIANQRNAYKRGVLLQERQKAFEQISGWSWKATGKNDNERWIKNYNCLREFVKREGHAQVPRLFVSKNGLKLGSWVQTQKYSYKKGALAEVRRRGLKDIPGWTWGSKEKKWLKKLDRLKKYVEREGHANVRADYICEDGYKLGVWVGQQRKMKRKGRLSEDRQNILNELPGWSCGQSTQWDQRYELLKQFCDNEGHSRVHQHYKTDDSRTLGSWVGTQRAKYKAGKLSNKKQELLEKLPGWVWNARKDRWPTGHKYLCGYAKSNGTSRVPAGYITEDGYNLGTWVTAQKVHKKQRLLSTNRQKQLEKLPGWTWGGARGTRQDWQESLSNLIEYAKEHGNTNVPYSYATKDGFTLGRWVSHQRSLYNKGKLSPERIKVLEQLNEWSWGASKTN